MNEAWQRLGPEETASRLAVSLWQGLSDNEVYRRLELFGPNIMDNRSANLFGRILLRQLKDIIVLALLGATVVSGLLGAWVEAVSVSVLVLLSVVLSVFIEIRAWRLRNALSESALPGVRVIRERMERKVPASELVLGDIIILEAGDRVPADIRLIYTVELDALEIGLNKNPAPVRKCADPGDKKNPLSPVDNLALNMVYRGTVITGGHGQGIVVATGMNTYLGKIGKPVLEEKKGIDTQSNISQLSLRVVLLCLTACSLVAVTGLLKGEAIYPMLLTALCLGVAAVPDGLPAMVTTAVVVGVRRMISRQVLFKGLSAVEKLSRVSYLCMVKTGTLTRNLFTVRRIYLAGRDIQVSGEGYDPKGRFTGDTPSNNSDLRKLLSIAALCNNAALYRDNIYIGGMFRKHAAANFNRTGPEGYYSYINEALAKDKLFESKSLLGLHLHKLQIIHPKKTHQKHVWHTTGDPTDGALLVLAAKGGIWKEHLEVHAVRVKELPFDDERKRMTVVYQKGNSAEILMKGAPEEVINQCTEYLSNGRRLPFDRAAKAKALNACASMAQDGLRTLALAYRESAYIDAHKPEGNKKANNYSDDRDIERNLIFVGITGMDDPLRPSAVAGVRSCLKSGLLVAMLTGDNKLTALAVARQARLVDCENQVLIGEEIDALNDRQLKIKMRSKRVFAQINRKQKSRLVRLLKQDGHVVAVAGQRISEGDIGIAMSQAGVVETGDAVVLMDDNLVSISVLIERCRGIYSNLANYIHYLLTCNTAEILVVLGGVLLGLPLPLLPAQILWANLITDGLPAFALGFEYSEKSKSPPKIHKTMLPRRNERIGHGLEILINTLMMAILTLGVFNYSLYSWGDLDSARCMAFNTLVFTQLLYVFSCCSDRSSVLYLSVAVVISGMLQFSVNYLPWLGMGFHTDPLSLEQWIIILGAATLPAIFGCLLQKKGNIIQYTWAKK